ncbi:hypothetical protein BDW72DRAFT_190131 [Aspergillus terricola var. indicus]
MMLHGQRQAQITPFITQPQHRPTLKRPFALSASSSTSSSPTSLSSAHNYGSEPTTKRNLLTTFEDGSNDKTYAQRFRERLEEYRACSEKELGDPFNPDRSPSCSCGLSPSPDRTVYEEDYDDYCYDDDDDDDDNYGVLVLDSVLSDGGCLCDGEHSDDTDLMRGDDVYLQQYSEPQPQLQQQFIPGHETEHYAPLSNEAISNILLQCAPHSPFTQTWIRTHRANEVNKAKKKALVKQRDDLRKQVLQLRPKSEWTMNRAAKVPVLKLQDDDIESEAGIGGCGVNSVGSREIPFPSEASSCENYNNLVGFTYRRRAYILDEKDKQWMKVFRSAGRLQVAASCEEASIVPSRTMQEFQKYFSISDQW